MDANAFLTEHPKPQPWGERHKGLTGRRFFAGQGRNPIEVAVAIAESRPTWEDARALWRKRQGGRSSPVLLVVLYDGGATAGVCGPVGDNPPVFDGLDPGQVERLSAHALNEPDRHAAVKSLTAYLPETGEDLPGIRNAGLMSAHALQTDVRSRPDWLEACKRARSVLTKRGIALVEARGFEVESRGTGVDFLLANGVKSAVAAFLDENETPEGNNTRFNGVSPVSYALSVADREGLPFVVVTRGPQIRLYAAGSDIGVGRKGRAETYIEANLALLPDDRSGFLTLLFGSAALSADGSFHALLERSREFATDLGSRLRERLYQDVVPNLATVIGRKGGKAPDLDFLYQQALVILFRLLFVAYAEDKELLPLHRDGNYRKRALKTLARELAAREGTAAFDGKATTYWSQIKELWAAIDGGDTDLGVPEYNGGLFSVDLAVYPVGAAIAKLSLTNADIGPALDGMLVDIGRDGVRGPVDFRSLSVREFGTIYEGLLESSLSLAPSDLALDKDQNFVPAKGKQAVVVRQGEVYLHNRSGARKATGSYFTKPFAVEHLLDHALKPALQDHLSRVSALLEESEEHKATDAFFDFRCADIAMGSGHFLVAAVDHIEAALSSFLADQAIPGVLAELERLRKAALDALGPAGASTPIEDSTLLRRQVARRCIYGVDKNKIAVELARVAMWIHTFVPGLPLSFLDHNLVHGDSLTGIGTLQEAADLLAPEAGGQRTVFSDQIEEWLGRARDALARLARTVDATAKEVTAAREAHAEAMHAVEPARDLFDLLVSVRLRTAEPILELDDVRIAAHKDLVSARTSAAELQSLHFPAVFPEVFLREGGGFDCILGNPPWEKVKVEEHTFWAVRFPGLLSLSISEQDREIARLRRTRPDIAAELKEDIERADKMRRLILKGPYPGMGTGDPDLYKAFAWRFWQLIAQRGTLGVVLPRSALSSAGTAVWRQTAVTDSRYVAVATLTNTGRWAFDMEPRYTVCLVALQRGSEPNKSFVRMQGPFASLEEYERGVQSGSVDFLISEFLSWSPTGVFPLLPTAESGRVFLKLRKHPRLDEPVGSWSVRPHRELDSNLDKNRMILKPPSSTDGLWPVYKGASFDLWQPDTGEYYAWVEPDSITRFLQAKRMKQSKLAQSTFAAFPWSWVEDPTTLPCQGIRIAFRRIARATDSRTVRASLVPRHVVLTDVAPYLVWTRGDEHDQAYLLGVMCSIPLDWYARRVVEGHVDFHVLNAFPIPRPESTNATRQIVEQSVLRLCGHDERFADWVKAAGGNIESVNESEREDLLAKIDAAVARLYGLDKDDVVHIFETFHAGWDYSARLRRVLEHFKRLHTVNP